MTASDRKLKDISLILKDLLKVIKVVSMYPQDNPLPQSLRRSFSEKLESIVDDYGELRIEVQAQCLIYNDNTVFQNTSKEENLAAIFFNAGITEITFKSGLDVLEIYKLLDVIKNYMNAPDKTQDLAALIWEAGIGALGLKTLEDIALSEYDSSFNIKEYSSSGGSDRDYESFLGCADPDGYQSIFSREDDSGKWETCDFDGVESMPEGHPGREFVAGEDGADDSPGGARGGERGEGRQAVKGQVNDVLQDVMGSVSGDLQYSELQESSADSVAVEAMGKFVKAGTEQGDPIPDSTLILNDEFKLSEEEEEIIRD